MLTYKPQNEYNTKESAKYSKGENGLNSPEDRQHDKQCRSKVTLRLEQCISAIMQLMLSTPASGCNEIHCLSEKYPSGGIPNSKSQKQSSMEQTMQTLKQTINQLKNADRPSTSAKKDLASVVEAVCQSVLGLPHKTREDKDGSYSASQMPSRSDYADTGGARPSSKYGPSNNLYGPVKNPSGPPYKSKQLTMPPITMPPNSKEEENQEKEGDDKGEGELTTDGPGDLKSESTQSGNDHGEEDSDSSWTPDETLDEEDHQPQSSTQSPPSKTPSLPSEKQLYEPIGSKGKSKSPFKNGLPSKKGNYNTVKLPVWKNNIRFHSKLKFRGKSLRIYLSQHKG